MTEFGVLGPLEVRVGRDRIGIAALKQRAVLALLVLHAGGPVDLDHIVAAVWDGRPPATATAAVRNGISALRKALQAAPGVELGTVGRRYVLHLDPSRLDSRRFADLRERGRRSLRAGEPREAVGLLDQALGLWRGPALADLVETGTDWPEIAELEELRLRTVEDRVEADLALGRHRPLVAELERLVRDHPGRETLHRLHMSALYADGRQAHALAAYQVARAELRDREGREPGRPLRELHQSILEQRADATPRARERASAPMGAGTVLGDRGGSRSPDVRRGADIAGVRSVAVLCLRIDVRAGSDVELDQVLGSVLERLAVLGGRALQTVGSSSLVVFGIAPGGDDCERAVLAALAVRELVRGTAAVDLTAAVAFGKVLVRPGQLAGARPGVVGQVLDDCARLLAAAPAGSVHVSEAARRATREVIGYAPAPGSSPSAWTATSPPVRHGPTGASAHRETFVGRGSEIGLLAALLHRVRDRRNPHLLTVMGPAGIGKTRLVREWLRRQPEGVVSHWLGPRVLDPEGGAQAPAAAILRRLASSRDRAASEASATWRELLAGTGSGGAAVVVIDDLQQADDGLLDLVEDLCGLAAPSPLLVVAVARPELLARRPGWGGGGHGDAVSLTVPPLTTRDAALLCG